MLVNCKRVSAVQDDALVLVRTGILGGYWYSGSFLQLEPGPC